jgi:predicted ATPase/transcriptional regulator with XRE-family HTH domain
MKMTAREPESLSALIRRFRLVAGLSQEQLAERSGLSVRAVSDIERGRRQSTRPETLRMLADGMELRDKDRESLLQAARPELRELARTTVSARSTGTKLPAPRSALVGREREVRDVVTRLDSGSRFLTLTGPGGVGKTRVAVEAARRSAERLARDALFVDLSPVTNPDQVAPAIAQALGIHDSAGQSIEDTLGLVLRDRRLLLVLDNFEQVIDAAPLAGRLLEEASDLRMLVTSREALRIWGEEEVVIEPLDLPTDRELADLDRLAKSASVELFVAAAMSVNPAFALTTENAGAVAEICRRLDGLPLAIELAASRVKHFPPALLLERLERRLPVLTGGSRDLPARQQTLRDTIAWSYDLLSRDEQALFRRVGAFSGGASLAALDTFTKVVGTLELELLSGLASLIEKSLVRERIGADGLPRFSMLETIREFAGEMAVRADELEASSNAVVEWALEFVASALGGELIWVIGLDNPRRVDEEIDNVRLAFALAARNQDADRCAVIFDGINDYLYLRGLYQEAGKMGKKVLELAETSPISDQLRGRTLVTLAGFWNMLFDASAAEQLALAGLSLVLSGTDRASDAIVPLSVLVMAIRDQERYADALPYAEQADALAATLPLGPHRALTTFEIGKLSYLLDDQDRAVEYLSMALQHSLALGASAFAAHAGNYLAAAHVRRGEMPEAASNLRLIVNLWLEAGANGPGEFLDEAAVLAAASQRPEIAARLFAAHIAQEAAFGMREDWDHWTIGAIETVRAQLGVEAFEAASREGRTLSLEAAIDMVMELLDETERETDRILD